MDVWITSCLYTAEYGAIAVEYQNAHSGKEEAARSVMAHIAMTFSKVRRVNVADREFDRIKEELMERGEFRVDWGNGNHYVWTLVKRSIQPQGELKVDKKLLKQFKEWARHLLKCNPGYVRNPYDLRAYVRGPNWDAADYEYAHYRECIKMYGPELIGMFERLRNGHGEDGLSEYRSLLKAANIKEDMTS